MKRICYICDTPYQVLNSLNHYYHMDDPAAAEADIYVCNWFGSSEQLTRALMETDLFANVYSYYYDLNRIESGLSEAKKRRIGTYMPGQFIRLTTGSKEASKRKYSLVLMSLYTPFSAAVVRNNTNAEVRLFDDGIATYIDYDRISIYAFPRMNDVRHRIFYSLFKKGIPRFTPSMIYVYNRSIDKIPYISRIEEMYSPGKWGEDFLNLIKKTFGYTMDGRYEQIKAVYLAPVDVPEGTVFSENVDLAEEVLKKYSDSLIVRVHPRAKDPGDRYRLIRIDEGKNMWEILCGDYITDDHILIGDYSTAQFNPKLMYDKEPWIVILYKVLQKERGEDTLKAMQGVIDQLKESYRDPEKIIVPENLKAFEETMEELMGDLSG